MKMRYGINPEIRETLKNTSRFIIIGLLHTSFYDGVHAVKFKANKEVRKIIPWEKTKIVMKKEMFPPIIGWGFKKLGFMPVDRKNSKNFLKNAYPEFEKLDEFAWAFAPEGTRKKINILKSGFLRAAEHFGIGIAIACINFKDSTTGIEDFVKPEEILNENGKVDTEKIPELVSRINKLVSKEMAKYPEKAGENLGIKWKGKIYRPS